MKIRLLKRINLKWAIPLTVCCSLVGFFIYALVIHPEIQWVYAVSILAVVLLTMAIIIGIDKDKGEEKK